MKTAIVTGSSKGIGLALSKRLLNLGYRVYGLARSFDKKDPEHPEYYPVIQDLLDTEGLEKTIKNILDREPHVHLLVNNAGGGFFGPHEQIRVRDIQYMVRLNLEVPLILSRLLLRPLKESRGTLLFVASATAKKASPHGCAYAATKAGLSHFAASLFEEARKAGVKVTTLYPDMTQSSFYDNQDFTCDPDPEAYINPDQVADAMEYVLGSGDNLSVGEVVLRPQINRIKRKAKGWHLEAPPG